MTITAPLAEAQSSPASINRSGVMMEFPQFVQQTMSNKEFVQQTMSKTEFVPLFGIGACSDLGPHSELEAELEAELASESGLSNTLYCIHNTKDSSKLAADTLGNRGLSVGSYSAYYLGKGKIAEEPLYIPATEQHEAYVLMTWLDYHNARSGLSLFRASDICAGPIASAQMNRVLPLGFHGCFINA